MRRSYYISVVFCFVIACGNAKLSSQNLVPNHSFEWGNCPTSIGQIWYSWGWNDAAGQTTDYFNPCGIPFMQPPSNLFGTQAAADGVCYAGFRASTPSDNNYYEFPAIELIEPLQPCQFYVISFKVSRGAGDQGGWWAVDQLGFALFDSVLTVSEFSYEFTYINTTFEPEYTTPPGVLITDSTGWTTISATYYANGGERYLVMGNFEWYNTNPVFVGGLSGFSAYYFLDDVHVELRQPPILGGDITICEGESFTFETNSADSVLWSDGSSNTALTVSAPGTYWVTIANESCIYSDTVIVTDSPNPVFDLGNDTTLCEGVLYAIGANIPGTYSWNSGFADHFISPTNSGTFALSITENGCTTTDEIDIQFEDCIFVPNAFSPNGDGQNDILFVRGYESGYFHFSVFDRWGIKVFETSDPAIGWDGMVNNQPGVIGVYMYVAEMDSEIYGGRYVLKGDVSLIR